jgi:hypothetical protein
MFVVPYLSALKMLRSSFFWDVTRHQGFREMTSRIRRRNRETWQWKRFFIVSVMILINHLQILRLILQVGVETEVIKACFYRRTAQAMLGLELEVVKCRTYWYQQCLWQLLFVWCEVWSVKCVHFDVMRHLLRKNCPCKSKVKMALDVSGSFQNVATKAGSGSAYFCDGL